MSDQKQLLNQSHSPRFLLRKRGALHFAHLDWVMLLGTLLVGVMLGWLSILRYTGYNAGMLDLGNMAQAIWSGTRGKPLVVTFPDGPLSRLAHHVELIYYLLVPLYAYIPDPRLLLVVQSGLFILGVIPVYRITMRRIGERFAARFVAFVYLFYPVAQTSVLFDFHGDTLAMPLLLFALDALDSRSWRRYALFIALTLSCKFYVALPIAALGVGLLFWGEQTGIGAQPLSRPPSSSPSSSPWRFVGGVTLMVALLYGATTFLIIRPIFAPPITGASLPTTPLAYLHFYFGQVAEVWQTFGDRLLNAVIVLGPAMLLAWRGWRWLIMGLPLALAMLLSSGPGGSYDFRYHHYALVVPFVIMAVIDGIYALLPHATPASLRRRWRMDLRITAISVMLFTILLVDMPLNPLFWMGIPGQGRDPSAYGQTARDRQKDWFLAEVVPASVPMAASMFLAPHLANRETLYLVRYPDDPGIERLPNILPRVDYVLTDALFDYFIPLDGESYGGGIFYERDAIAALLRDPDFHLVAMHDGLLLFGRDADTIPQPFVQDIETIPISPASPPFPLATFGNAIGLITATVVLQPTSQTQTILPIPSIRYHATFDWIVLGSTSPGSDDVIISRIVEGDSRSVVRIVHLPTYARLPMSQWPPEHIIRETFSGELPASLFQSTKHPQWEVSHYQAHHPYSYATDARSQRPGSYTVTLTGLRY